MDLNHFVTFNLKLILKSESFISKIKNFELLPSTLEISTKKLKKMFNRVKDLKLN